MLNSDDGTDVISAIFSSISEIFGAKSPIIDYETSISNDSLLIEIDSTERQFTDMMHHYDIVGKKIL